MSPQYAYECPIIMDCASQSNDGKLGIWDSFVQVSGLKINFTKTQMIWIGRKTILWDVFLHAWWKLSWDNLNFELLSINFAVTQDEMEDFKYL